MKPFLHGKKSLAVASLRLPTGPVGSTIAGCGSAPASAAQANNANVEVVKEGDKVVRLIITCGCGERVEIECLYQAGT